jgi:hypothetical protein
MEKNPVLLLPNASVWSYDNVRPYANVLHKATVHQDEGDCPSHWPNATVLRQSLNSEAISAVVYEPERSNKNRFR